MAQTVKLKRSAVSGNTPTTSDLALGEIAINTYDGNIFIKKNDGTESIVTFSPGSNAGTIEEDSFSGNGSTTAFTLSTAPSSEEHLLVFIDATFQNRDSFTISGTTITFDTAPDNGSSVRVYHVIPGSVDDGVLTVAKFAADTLVLESEGISSNDNDTTIPTSAAVKDYVDTQVATVDTLPEVLANGNTTGGTDISVSTGDDITFADSSKAIFGAGSDLQIYHDGTHSYIKDAGTGRLRFQASTQMDFLNGAGTETLANFIENGAVKLYYDNAEKLTTTSIGIDVTGKVIASDWYQGASSTNTLYSSTSQGTIIQTPSNTNNAAGTFYIRDSLGNVHFALNTNTNVVDITGSVTADGLTVDGASILNATDTATNTVSTALKIGHKTSGTTANGFGSALEFEVENSTYSTIPVLAKIESVSTNEVMVHSDLNFYTKYNNALQKRMSFNNGGDISFYEDTGTTAKFFWDASAESLGIGTSSPNNYSSSANDLVIAGSGQRGITIASTDANQSNLFFADADTGTGEYAGYFAYFHATDSLAIATNATEAMRIDSSGNVGVGTSSPDKLLHLSANTGATLRLESTDTNIAANEVIGAIEWEGNDATTASAGVAGKIDLIAEDATPEYSMRFFTHDNLSGIYELEERMRIKSDGNVGIGTSSPASNLHIKTSVDNSVSQGLVIERSANSDRGYINYNGGAFRFVATDGDPIKFGHVSSSDRVTIDSSGLVGIGTSSPVTGLQVVGQHISIDNGLSYQSFTNAGTRRGLLGVDSSDTITIGDTGFGKITILSSGNVGIGETSPGSLLHVKASDTGIAPHPSSQITLEREGTNYLQFLTAETGTSGILFGDGSDIDVSAIRVDHNTTKMTFTNETIDTMTLNGANVGIGLLNPSEKLHVYGTSATISAKVEAGDGNQASLDLKNSEGEFRLINDGGELYVYDSTDAAERFRIDTSGNSTFSGNITTTGYLAGPATFTIDPAAVGDNTGTVVIAGNLQVDGTTTTINSTTLTVDDKLVTLASGSINAAAADGAGIEVDISGSTNPSLTYDGTNTTWDFNESVEIASGKNIRVNTVNNVGNTANIIYRSSTNTIVGNNASALVVQDAGNVGIGYTTPYSKLWVETDGINLDDFSFEDASSIAHLTLAGSNSHVRMHLGTMDVSPYGVYIQGSFDNTPDASGTGSSGTKPLSLNPLGGNVGIGTTSPQDTLHVVTDSATTNAVVDVARIEATSSGTPAVGFGPVIEFRAERGAASSDSVGRIGFVADTMTTTRVDGAFVVQTAIDGSFSERMRIDSSGNVGVGTTSPSFVTGSGLEIQRTTADATLRLEHTGANAFELTTESGQVTYNSVSSKPHVFEIGSSPKMTIDASGRVGIGTSSPQGHLDINTETAEATTVILNGEVNQDKILKFRHYANSEAAGNGYAGFIGSVIDNVLTLGHYNNSNTEVQVLHVTEGGNVGIGTDGPTANLTVQSTTNINSSGNYTNKIAPVAIGDVDGVDNSRVLLVDSNQIETIGDGLYLNHTSSQKVLMGTGGGNVGVGNTNPSAKFQVEEYGIDTTETSTTATTQVAIHTFAAATFRSARFTIQVTNSTDSTYHLTEILMIHDGTTPSITEYGTIFTGAAAEATFDADINTGNVRLLATPASTDTMEFKVVSHSITT